MKSIEITKCGKEEEKIDSPWLTKELYVLWGKLTFVGTSGGLIFTILLSTITVLTIFSGNLPNSAVYVAAMGTGCAYMGIAGSFAFGANAGLNAIVARLKGTNDSKMLNFFLQRQMKLLGFNAIFMVVYACFCYVLFGFIYASNPMLCFWSRVFMGVICVGMILIVYMDCIRNFYLGAG